MKKVALIFTVMLSTLQAQQTHKEWVQEQNVPGWVQGLFRARNLDQKYEFSFHLNPFYLRGDFNGDGKPDVAILVKARKSKKIGIAICHSDSTVYFAGAGTFIGNGGDDFQWMDAWSVFPKSQVHQGVTEASPPKLIGEALLVAKTESASALIYWDGAEYMWYQQGD